MRTTMKGIVIGASAGGLDVLDTVLSALPADFALPILVVQHLPPPRTEPSPASSTNAVSFR